MNKMIEDKKESGKHGNEIDIKSKLNATLNCPFCDSVISRIVEMEPWLYEYYKNENEYHGDNTSHESPFPLCDHVAFYGAWRWFDEHISDKWKNEMMILAKDLGAEFIESETPYENHCRETSAVNVIAKILYSDTYIKVADNFENIQDTVNRLFPDLDSLILKEDFYGTYYAIIFMNKEG